MCAPTLAREVFFFFQAEDGIRDDLVTGVQTCALPISSAPARARSGGSGRPPPRRLPAPVGHGRPCRRQRHGRCPGRMVLADGRAAGGPLRQRPPPPGPPPPTPPAPAPPPRSPPPRPTP